jgi:hypothetical protein
MPHNQVVPFVTRGNMIGNLHSQHVKEGGGGSGARPVSKQGQARSATCLFHRCSICCLDPIVSRLVIFISNKNLEKGSCFCF